jgi:hypothetical protein
MTLRQKLGLEQLVVYIAKRLKFQCIAAGVAKKQGGLFTHLPLKTNSGFDVKLNLVAD